MKHETILSITAHPDDEVLGFGGTAHKLTQKGIRVVNCFLSGDVNARVNRPGLEDLQSDITQAQNILGCDEAIMGPFPNMEFNTVKHLEMVQFIESVIDSVKPDEVFTHSAADLNNDHLQTSRACLAACRIGQRRNGMALSSVYLMEVQSSTDWSFNAENTYFTPNTWSAVDETSLGKKLEALNSYRGVMRPPPHPRSTESITALAITRGTQIGVNFAESFQCVHRMY